MPNGSTLQVAAVFFWALCLSACATPYYSNPALKRDPTNSFLQNQDRRIIDQLESAVKPPTNIQETSTAVYYEGSAYNGTPGPLPIEIKSQVMRVFQRLIAEESFLGNTPPISVDDCHEPVASFNGHWISLCKGLILSSDSEDELAFVLAHELAHSYLNHTSSDTTRENILFSTMSILAESYVQAYTSVALGYVGGLAEDAGASKESLDQFYESGARGVLNASGATYGGLKKIYLHPRAQFQQRQETAADLLAADLLERAGYNPRVGLQVMRSLADRPMAPIDNRYLASYQLRYAPKEFQSHPDLQARVDDFQQYLSKHYGHKEPNPVTALPWETNDDFARFRSAALDADGAMILAQEAWQMRKKGNPNSEYDDLCRRASNMLSSADSIIKLDADYATRDIALRIVCKEHKLIGISIDRFNKKMSNFEQAAQLGYYFGAYKDEKNLSVVAERISKEYLGGTDFDRMKFLYSVGHSRMAETIASECFDDAKKRRDEDLVGTEEYPDLRSDIYEEYNSMRSYCSDRKSDARQYRKSSAKDISDYSIQVLRTNSWLLFLDQERK